MKERAIAILKTHDGLKAHERALFAEYLDVIFTPGEAAATGNTLRPADRKPSLAERLSTLKASKPYIASVDENGALVERPL